MAAVSGQLVRARRRVACLIFGHIYDHAWPFDCLLGCGKVDAAKVDVQPWTLTDL